MALGDIYKTVFYMQSTNQAGLNVRHMVVANEVTGGATREEIANALFAKFGSTYALLLSSQAQFRGVGVQRIRPLPLTVETFSTTLFLTGTKTGDLLPRQTSGILTLRTALAGRKNRGRVYVPFPAEVSNDNNSGPVAQYLEDLGALGDLYVAPTVVAGATGTTTLNSIIFHRTSGMGDVITGFRVNDAFATQRRRGDYGAANITPV